MKVPYLLEPYRRYPKEKKNTLLLSVNYSNSDKIPGECPNKKALNKWTALHASRHELVLSTAEVRKLALGSSGLC